MKKEQFRELYEFCQKLDPVISRKVLLPRIKEITNTPGIQVVKTTLDTTVTCGYFISISSPNHPYPIYKEKGFEMIVLSRNLNDCWERFVNTKELMHLFDESGEKTDTPAKFERLVLDFEAPAVELSPQYLSDNRGIWMALACLCPERVRLELLEQRTEKNLNDYGIALKLKIPEQYVAHLFRADYRQIIDSLLT
jgi:hypothetical protein